MEVKTKQADADMRKWWKIVSLQPFLCIKHSFFRSAQHFEITIQVFHILEWKKKKLCNLQFIICPDVVHYDSCDWKSTEMLFPKEILFGRKQT